MTEREGDELSREFVDAEGESIEGVDEAVGILKATRMTKGSVDIEHRMSATGKASGMRLCDGVGDRGELVCELTVLWLLNSGSETSGSVDIALWKSALESISALSCSLALRGGSAAKDWDIRICEASS